MESIGLESFGSKPRDHNGYNYRHTDVYYISEIHPKLFISGWEPAYDEDTIKKHKITHIVNVTGASFGERAFEISDYLQIHVMDTAAERMHTHFNKITMFIKQAHENDGVVLVHCRAGISRSATAVLAHLMVNEAYKLPEAWDVLRKARKIVNPNKTFVMELRMLERATYGKNFDVAKGKIGYEDSGEVHDLDWVYSLAKLHDGWRTQKKLTQKADYPKLKHGVFRLVWSKLCDAAREDIPMEEAISHLGDVICAWFRLGYPTKGERLLLFRILWRALLNTPVDDNMPRERFRIMIDQLFASERFYTFAKEVTLAPSYAEELKKTITSWRLITRPDSEVEDFKKFLDRKDTMSHPEAPSVYEIQDELLLEDVSATDIIAYLKSRKMEEEKEKEEIEKNRASVPPGFDINDVD